MIADSADLVRALSSWIDDGGILSDTRKFLKSGPSSPRSGLGDGQIQNWRRRGGRLPSSFIEGAALYHCAQARSVQLHPAKEIGIAGDSFWQVFVVHNAVDDNQQMVDCTILRYWHGVRARGTTYFAHTAYRSTGETAVKDDVCPLPKDDSSFERHFDHDGTVLVSWQIDREPRDLGYVAHFPGAIRNNHAEAVGGSPTIPVGAVHLLVFLPRSVIDRQRQGHLPSNPRGIPTAFATLLNGNPVHVMESYLESHTRLGFLRLGPWFREGPLVEFWHGSHRLPQPIREHKSFESAQNSVHEGDCEAFVANVDDPLPFLTYFMVFG